MHKAIQTQKKHMNPLQLKLYIDGPKELINKYNEHVNKHNYSLLLNTNPDSGFDLFSATNEIIKNGVISHMIDLQICGALFEETSQINYDSKIIYTGGLATIILLLLCELSTGTILPL